MNKAALGISSLSHSQADNGSNRLLTGQIRVRVKGRS